MVMQTKDKFKYAILYDSKNDSYCTDNSVPGLVMGPETSKRYQENEDQCAVTVCCITYNHEDYIRQALDSFLMQKTNFKFQVFVGEDCGTDETADIILEYAQKYPDIIVPFIREKNLGAQKNLIDLCQHAKSPYIAFCEGDDYWIDEYKLQKQYDYMQGHEDIRLCFTKTEILAPEDWHLNSYYKHEKDGRMLYPNCEPGFVEKPYYTMRDFILKFPNHTSSAFYRWNYDLDIPDWYYEGRIGDMPITSMQLGKGKAVYLADVTSVYRRSDVGIWMNHSDDEHFANTRLDYLHILSGLRHYFNQNYGNYLDDIFKYRTTLEISNYLTSAKNFKDTEMLKTLIDQYPEETFQALHTFLGSYNIYNKLSRKLGDKDWKSLYSSRFCAYFAIPGIKVFTFLKSIKNFFLKVKAFITNYILMWFYYWGASLVKKEKNLWVFTGFRGTSFSDNSMYFYEYVLEHHPEVHAIWLSSDKQVMSQLLEEGKPVQYAFSKEGRRTLARAEIAVTDHFVMSDYKYTTQHHRAVYGFNAKTKVVQLWHGIGLKSMGDENQVKNTNEKGVIYSRDILPKDDDGFFARLKKKIKYVFIAPFRELFEKYFLFTCPGWERANIMAKLWKIPEDSIFMVGEPRDLPVYYEKRQETPVKIIYAPTYRFDYDKESSMVQSFLDVVPQIQKFMEQVNGEFYLRLHPHTWRNYSTKIQQAIEKCDRIIYDTSSDIYQTLGTYSIMISDYSSLAISFARWDRPTIFLALDYEWYSENEAGFNIDYPNAIPGPMTRNWEETFKKIYEYIKDPYKDSELRKEKCEFFYDSSVNGPDSSERIVQEIEKRIGLN